MFAFYQKFWYEIKEDGTGRPHRKDESSIQVSVKKN
jgi:hypothetical protein